MWAKDFVSNGNISNIAEEAHPLLINVNMQKYEVRSGKCEV